MINVAVFAHQEEAGIVRCLESVAAATREPTRLDVRVLANGCSDRTVERAAEFCRTHAGFRLDEIALGDKSNAWNHYVHGDIDPDARHYFLDGDNWLPALALDAIESVWDDGRDWAVAPLPIGVAESLRHLLGEHRWISGNFYGVSGEFVSAVRRAEFRLPVGYIGDDSLVSWLLERGLDGNGAPRGVAVVENTGPVIPRVPIDSRNLGMLHRRYKRYALRYYQQEVFYALAGSGRLRELPGDATGIRPHLRALGLRTLLRPQGVQTLYHPWALARIARGRDGRGD